MSPVRILAVVLLLGALPLTRAESSGAAGLPTARGCLVRTWETDQGLADNDVRGAAQGPGGYLWITTAKGLMRFDGIHFTAVPPDPAWPASAAFVGGVFAAKDGAIWVGVRDVGLARLSTGGFEIAVSGIDHADLREGLRSFAEDGEGAPWFTCHASSAVFRWKQGVLARFGEKEGIVASGVPMVRAAANGRIWFANERAVGWFEGDQPRLAAPGPSWQAHQIAPARDGGMWVTRYDVLEKYHETGSRVRVADIAPIEGPRAVNQMHEDASGDLWLATTGVGLVRWRDGRFTRVPTAHNDVVFVTEDREGNLWAGTRGGGLERIRRSRFALHQAGADARNDHVVSVAADASHRLWLAPFRYPPVRAVTSENHTFSRLPGWGSGLINGITTALCPDPAGGVWIGTSTGLLGWRDGGFFSDLPQRSISSLLVDRAGDLWLATHEGALIRRSAATGACAFIPTDAGLLSVRALAQSADGQIWAGTEAGRLFRSADASGFIDVPLPDIVSGNNIQFIVPEADGALWIGVRRAGLFRWKDGSARMVPAGAGLPLGDIRSFAFGADGEIWIGTGDQGLLGIAHADLLAALEQPARPIPFLDPDRAEGVPAAVFVNGYQNSVARTRDAHLWFATTRGVLEIGPPLPPRPAHSSGVRVRIERVSLGGRPLVLDEAAPLALPPQAGALEIRYTLPLLSTPERVRFRYRLRESDADWIQAETQRTAVFTRLPPGAYRFEVQAADGDGPWLPGPASLAFSVRPAWWETHWFRLAAALAAAAALAIGVRHLVRRRFQARMRALEQRHAVEQERARLARDLHDQVGANLTQISLLADFAPSSPDCVAQLAEAARQAVDGLDAVVWAADPRHDTLDSLLHYLVRYTEDFLKPTEIRHRVDFPIDVPARPLTPDFRHHVLLIVKEVLNNAVKYSGASELRLGVTLSPDRLALVITDNGHGFDPVAASDSGNGLRHLRERAGALGGEARIESGADGTRLLLSVPWPRIDPLAP